MQWFTEFHVKIYLNRTYSIFSQSEEKKKKKKAFYYMKNVYKYFSEILSMISMDTSNIGPKIDWLIISDFLTLFKQSTVVWG